MPVYLPPGVDICQGDIYTAVPSIYVRDRPILVACPRGEPRDGRQQYFVHEEGGREPQRGWRWHEPQPFVVTGRLSLAILLTHDCEIDWDETCVRLVAPVRPITDLGERTRDRVRANRVATAFRLPAFEGFPPFPESFVDFRRTSTLTEPVLRPGDRVTAISEETRKALARRFWLYLFRKQVRPQVDEDTGTL